MRQDQGAVAMPADPAVKLFEPSQLRTFNHIARRA